MIQGIREYTVSIVTLIVAITIVELILPNNKTKKYVMFISGLIITLNVVNPILKLFNSNFDVSSKVNELQDEINQNAYNSATNYDLSYNIYNTYISNLENDMKERFSDMGYEILDTKINLNDNYEPEEIEMQIKYDDGYIQPIVIDVFNNNGEEMNLSDINKIKSILNTEYGIPKENIKINEKNKF